MFKKAKNNLVDFKLTMNVISVLMVLVSVFYVLKAAPVLFIAGILLIGAYIINPDRKKIIEFFKKTKGD